MPKKKTRAKTVTLENKLKELEQKLDCIFSRNKLEQIFEKRLMVVRSEVYF